MDKARDWRDRDQPTLDADADLAQAAFAFLQHNETYQRSFADLPPANSPGDEIERDNFARQWGLRFRG